jgi:hypothetical protein
VGSNLPSAQTAQGGLPESPGRRHSTTGLCDKPDWTAIPRLHWKSRPGDHSIPIPVFQPIIKQCVPQPLPEGSAPLRLAVWSSSGGERQIRLNPHRALDNLAADFQTVATRRMAARRAWPNPAASGVRASSTTASNTSEARELKPFHFADPCSRAGQLDQLRLRHVRGRKDLSPSVRLCDTTRRWRNGGHAIVLVMAQRRRTSAVRARNQGTHEPA